MQKKTPRYFDFGTGPFVAYVNATANGWRGILQCEKKISPFFCMHFTFLCRVSKKTWVPRFWPMVRCVAVGAKSWDVILLTASSASLGGQAVIMKIGS